MSNEQLQQAVRVLMVSRVTDALQAGSKVIFVETDEMAILLGLPKPDAVLPDTDTATIAIDLAEIAQVHHEMACEADTQPVKVNLS